MQRSSPNSGDVGIAMPTAPTTKPKDPQLPLSVVHARALYRPVPPVDVDECGYPYSDSSTVESQNHERARAYLVAVVRAHFADRADVYAASELGLYFERGNRKALVVPDAFVAFGIVDHPDLSFKLWEQPTSPAFVLEVLSRRTWKKDVQDKPALYAALGVREYWLFDPYRSRRDGGAQLVGWRLDSHGTWLPVESTSRGDGLVSEVLDLDVLVTAGQFRLRDRQTGELLPDLTENMRLRKREAARADREATRADREVARAEAAQRRIAELEEALRQAEGR